MSYLLSGAGLGPRAAAQRSVVFEPWYRASHLACSAPNREALLACIPPAPAPGSSSQSHEATRQALWARYQERVAQTREELNPSTGAVGLVTDHHQALSAPASHAALTKGVCTSCLERPTKRCWIPIGCKKQQARHRCHSIKHVGDQPIIWVSPAPADSVRI
jgi:hypothetical protein